MIEKKIIETLGFFNQINHSLTIIELFRFLHGENYSLCEIKFALDLLVEKNLIVQKQGLYALEFGIIDEIIQNDLARITLWKRVKMIMPLLLINPFVRAIALSGSISFNAQKKLSDIDFFIVSKKNRVWLARFFSAFIFKILRLRPGETKYAPICLSFFVDEEHLDMSNLLIENDYYFAHWTSALIWIYDSRCVRRDFAKKNARWIFELLDRIPEINYLRMKKSGFFGKFFFLCISVFDNCFSEKFFRKIQETLMPIELKEKSKFADSAVVLNDFVLKMHFDDARNNITKNFCDFLNQSA